MCRYIQTDADEVGVVYGVPNPKKTGNTGKAGKSEGWSGKTTHPRAPSGGGGPGGFKVPGVEKSLAASGRAKKPPPVTVPIRKPILVRKNKDEDIEVYVEVREDITGDDNLSTGAKTKIDGADLHFATPNFEYVPKKGRNIVTKLTGPFELKGTIVIQTSYAVGSNANVDSLYGRGTTRKDKASGNTSLGFHEHCHQKDYRRFLKTNRLPRFAGKVGQTEAAFRKAEGLFKKALDKYWDKVDKYSERRTDEVGYKRSSCVRQGKC
jgi:hypothetical protein